MNKLGVIQVIDSLNAGGAEVLAINIANLLHEEGINSHLCVTRKEGILKENIKDEIGYIFLKRNKSIDFYALLTFKKHLKKNKIGIIHAHSTSSFFAFCVKLIHPKVKIIWHDHYGKSQELNLRKTFPLNIFSFFFKSIISVNSNLKTWAKDTLYCKEVYFLNNFPIFNNTGVYTYLKGKKGKRIIHLAAFREQKDHQTLIKSFKIFLEENKDWSLHLVGEINNDYYYEKIIALIKINGLEKYIFVYGSCLDIANILKQSTIGVLSSKSEGLPIALLEYGLAKLPVIVTDVGECAAVVEHNKSGILVASDNIKQLKNALNTLSNSNEKRNNFGELHYKNVVKSYSKENFIYELLKIYTT